MAPGTSEKSNPNAMATVTRNSIFTNVALTPDGDVWWEGMTKTPPPELIDWRGQPWTPDSGRPAAHPNARFTAPASQCPSIDPDWENPQGVPIGAFVFGGRRSDVVPLVYQAFNWNYGVYTGRHHGRRNHRGRRGPDRRGAPRSRWPCCPSAATTWAITSTTGCSSAAPSPTRPRSSTSTGSARTRDGNFLWPGFGENMRILKWIVERARGRAIGVESPIGRMPRYEDIDWRGMEDFSPRQFHAIMAVDRDLWKREVLSHEELFIKLYDRLPKEMIFIRELMLSALWRSPQQWGQAPE